MLNRKNVRLPHDAQHDQTVIQWLQIETSKCVEVSGGDDSQADQTYIPSVTPC